MHFRFVCCIASGILIGLALPQILVSVPAQSQDTKQEAKTLASTDLDGLKAAAANFEKAYNAGDAKAIAAGFTEDAEVVDEDGNVIEGRTNIEARFAETFKENPKARIEVELTSLRQISSNVAIEEGFSTTTLTPDEPGSRSPYTIVHIKRDGKWLVARIRDFPEEATALTAHEQLRSLEWLVGKWVDESDEGRVHTTCKWSDDGNYLLQDYVVKTRRGVEMQGTQRIAWDPFRRTIRSWAFDDSGAFTEATWTPLEDGWILKTEGVTPSGEAVSVTRRVTLVSVDAYQIDSTSYVIGSELLPDSTVRVVRIPPAPGQ